jgi:hypothetical protein
MRVKLALGLAALAVAGCGGDDEDEPAGTRPADTATQPAPATETAAMTETAPPPTTGDPDEEISRADAASETARLSLVAAEDVPDSDLYFAGADDVECEARGATQPDNANEQAPEWTCKIDAETNGVHCEGTATIYAKPGANPGKTFEGIESRDVDIDCERA